MNKTHYFEVPANFLVPSMDTICRARQNCNFSPHSATFHYAQEVLILRVKERLMFTKSKYSKL